MKLPDIWVVFCEPNDEIAGIYPNDQSKAQSTFDVLRQGQFDARIVKYQPSAEPEPDDNAPKSTDFLP